MVNMLVMLDAFTIENGATYLLAKSHKIKQKPEADRFFSFASRAVGSPGDALIFDSRLWHAAGENSLKTARRALTLTFTPPQFKPQFDYCQALGYSFVETLEDPIKQVVGYFSRVPASLEDWYQPPAERFYRPDQNAETSCL